MARYMSLVKQQLWSFAAWKLEHILRNSNERADALAAVVHPNERNCIPPNLLPAGIVNCNGSSKSDR